MLSDDGVIVFNRLYYAEKRKLAESFSSKLERKFRTVERVFPEANIMFVVKK